MPFINFKYGSVPLWAEYKAYDYDDIDILAITASDSKVDIIGIVDNAVFEKALEAAEQDYRELIEYKRECQLEMRNSVLSD